MYLSLRDSGHRPLMISWDRITSPVPIPCSETCSRAVNHPRARYFGVHLGEPNVRFSWERIIICKTVAGKPPWRGCWRSGVMRPSKNSAPPTRESVNCARLLRKPRTSVSSPDGRYTSFELATNLTRGSTERRLYSLTRSTGSTKPSR